MAATFLLLTVLVQVATAMTARSAADAAVAAATRRAALEDADPEAEEARLLATLERIVPGARQVRAAIRVFEQRAVGVARIQWEPPGPILSPFEIVVRAEVARAPTP